jgi:transmembrane sensor
MVEQAACWSAQFATDEATQADRDACEAWCDEHPLHRLAMERMRGFDAQFNDTDEVGREAIETVLERRSAKGRWFGGLMVGLGLLAGGGWLTTQSLTVRAWFPDYETARGEQRTVTLADGSNLTLDTDAALDVRPARPAGSSRCSRASHGAGGEGQDAAVHRGDPGWHRDRAWHGLQRPQG